MKSTSFSVFLMLVAGVLSPCRLSHATSDSARVYSIYFHEMTDTGAQHNIGNFYATHWRVWLQFHRAIEKSSKLQSQLLKLPSDPYEGRKGAVALMHKNLSYKFVTSQPNSVFVLQLGVFKTSSGLSSFLTQQWPKAAKKSIYNSVPKDFRVGASTEAMGKREPLFLISEKQMSRLCYGIYGSTKDAQLDAAQLKKHLGCHPVVVKRNLTAELARSFIFEPVAGRLP